MKNILLITMLSMFTMSSFAEPILNVPADRRDCLVNPLSNQYSYQSVKNVELVAGQVFTILVTVLFDFDSYELNDGSELKDFYDAIVEGGVEEILVIGHTDSVGTEVYNEELGLQRAASVAYALEELNEVGLRIEIDTAGEGAPVASNDDLAGRQLNRRVGIEIVRVKEQEVVTYELVRKQKDRQVFRALGSGGPCTYTRGTPELITVPVGERIGVLQPSGRIVINRVPR